MNIHKYWGKVQENWKGFSGDINFSNSFFEKQNVEIFLGEEYDNEGEEIDTPPELEVLDEFAETYQNFIDNIELNIKNIQEKSYKRYLKLYAHFYENAEKSGETPLNINSVDKHSNYIREIMYLRVLDDKTIKISIRYKLDKEHGLEFNFSDGQVVAVGGIAET